MTIATPATATADNRAENSAPENAYATLFLTYINQSLAESLATVHAVATKLPDEERVQACHILDFGLRATESWPSTSVLMVALASYMERSGQWESWQQFLERAIATAQRLGDTDHEITLTPLLARLYQRRGDASVMVRAYRRVIRLARRYGNRYELARACSNLGFHFIEQGYLWRAEQLNYYALTTFTELQSNHGRAHTHNHLGILLTRQYEWAKAEEHLLAACTIWQKSQDQYGLMRGYGNLGFLYHETANYRDAIYYSTLAIELAERLGEEPLTGVFAINISAGNLHTGDLQKAQEFALRAQAVFEKYSDQFGLAQIAHMHGLIAIEEKEFLQAQRYINYALNGLTEHYFLVQAKFTKVQVEIQLHNYTVAEQALDEIEALLTKHFADNALQFYADKLRENRHRLAQAFSSTPE